MFLLDLPSSFLTASSTSPKYRPLQALSLLFIEIQTQGTSYHTRQDHLHSHHQTQPRSIHQICRLNMLAHTVLALGAIALTSVSAQSQSICQASPYKGLGCLASNTAAANDCSSRLPVVTSTTTSTTSVLSQITESPRAKSPVTSQVTVNITNFETSTETVTW